MTCYAVPAAAYMVHFLAGKKNFGIREDRYQKWLSNLLLGGAVFGIVDHLWNGELFLIGDNFVSDIMLGLVITLAIFGIWAVMVVADKQRNAFRHIRDTKSQQSI